MLSAAAPLVVKTVKLPTSEIVVAVPDGVADVNIMLGTVVACSTTPPVMTTVVPAVAVDGPIKMFA